MTPSAFIWTSERIIGISMIGDKSRVALTTYSSMNPAGESRWERAMARLPASLISRGLLRAALATSKIWDDGVAEFSDRLQRLFVRRTAGLAQPDYQVIGLNFCLPFLELLETIRG